MRRIGIYINSFWQGMMSIALISAFVSCSVNQEEVLNPPDESDTDIEATVAETRGEYLDAKNITQFAMHGINNGTQAWTIRNIEYKLNNKGKWKGSDTYSWPALPNTLSFFAVSPSFAPFDASKAVVEYGNVSLVYTAPSNASDQVDVLYGSMLNQDRNTNNKKVSFTFKHGLCYQRFKGKNTLGDRYTVIVKSISLCRVRPTATMKYNMKKANKVSWTTDLTSPFYDTTIDLKDENGNDGVVMSTSSTGAFLTDDYMMTVPQSLTLWKTDGKDNSSGRVSIEEAIAANKHYWKIEAKIIDSQETADTSDDRYLLGNSVNTDPDDPEWGIVYMQPIAREWEYGNTYLNTVSFAKTSLFNADGVNFFDALEQETGEGFLILGADNIDTVITTEEWLYDDEEDLDLLIDEDYENNN